VELDLNLVERPAGSGFVHLENQSLRKLVEVLACRELRILDISWCHKSENNGQGSPPILSFCRVNNAHNKTVVEIQPSRFDVQYNLRLSSHR
jgi:hypothetical protein